MTLQRSFIPPGKTGGIICHGQLGRMSILHSYGPFGYLSNVFGPPSAESPIGCGQEVATYRTLRDYTDEQARLHFIKSCDFITVETENLFDTKKQGDLMIWMHKNAGDKLFPSLDVIMTSADRFREKLLFKKLNIPSAAYIEVHKDEKLAMPSFQGPFINKLRFGGFDGRGNDELDAYMLNELHTSILNRFGNVDCILEEKVNFDFECSMGIARNANGEVGFTPLSYNIQKNGILIETKCSLSLQNHPVVKIARDYLLRIAKELNLIGFFVAEMFAIKEKSGQYKVMINETAPRVHNSIHHSIESCSMSQFEMQLRAMCNLPLHDSELICESVTMTNILYEYSQEEYLHWLSIPNTYVHLYNKKPNGKKTDNVTPRKIGHITQLYY